MISIAIITLGVCAVICTFIICVTKYNLDEERRAWKRRFFSLGDSVMRFVEEFNDTYNNTRIELDSTGIHAIDVEPEDE